MYQRKSENGQAIVLIVIGIIALLGFAALAIDGGMVYSDRRNAQNSADAAALAGALQKSNNGSHSQIIDAAKNSLVGNGFNYHLAKITTSQYTDVTGNYTLVTVELTSTTQTTFMQLITGGNQMVNHVTAVARARMNQPVMPGIAVVAMGDCTSDGDPLVAGSGGGNSGGVRTYNGGIFLNTGGDNGCALDPGSSANSYGIYTDRQIWSVGGESYSGVGNIDPLPVNTGVNGGFPIDDPLYDLPEPTCTANGHKDTSTNPTTYYPGNWNGGQLGGGIYMPGIYCINGDVHLSGSEALVGDYIVLYFHTGGLNFTGSAYMDVTAPEYSPPSVINCLGTPGDTTASCTYYNIALFAARNNHSTFEIRGNGANALLGMIYALNGTVMARGGGSNPQDAVIVGQVICKSLDMRGGGDANITYNAGRTYYDPTRISLQR